MGDSKIEWTDVTWNPIRGCSVISPGCVNCYAMKQAHRFSGKGKAYEGLTKQTKAGPQWTGKVMLAEKQLLEPLSWGGSKKVFVNSMADLFHESVPDEWIDQIFAVMALAGRHTFQVLTKRAQRMHDYFADKHTVERIEERLWNWHTVETTNAMPYDGVLRNVWLGVSVEHQQFADVRIPLLLQTPAAVRFISYEPALGPVDLRTLSDWARVERLPFIDWVIVGGESGPGARPFDVAWARAIVQQCAAAGVACFVKQLGRWPSAQGEKVAGWQDLWDNEGEWAGSAPFSGGTGKHGDPAAWPADLQVRQFPEAHA